MVGKGGCSGSDGDARIVGDKCVFFLPERMKNRQRNPLFYFFSTAAA